MKIAKNGMSAVCIDTLIFVFGGLSNESSLNIIEKYII